MERASPTPASLEARLQRQLASGPPLRVFELARLLRATSLEIQAVLYRFREEGVAEDVVLGDPPVTHWRAKGAR
jgi:hypothetical protein